MPGIKESVTLDEVLGLLNEALEIDADAVNALVNARVRCTRALGDHPTIQVIRVELPEVAGDPSEIFIVGLLGILNGCFGIDDRGFGPIAAEADGAPPRIRKFVRLPPGIVERVEPAPVDGDGTPPA